MSKVRVNQENGITEWVKNKSEKEKLDPVPSFSSHIRTDYRINPKSPYILGFL